jgi:superfamily II RNA helicase
MMTRGYLEAIFSTSTVAAGVNFPARTVVLVQSDRYDGREFIDLSSTDLHQMIGRAGRRGKDNIGFALIIPGLHQDPQLIHELRDAPPDSLKSQIRINFSMTLNLLLSHRPTEVKDLLDRSFAAFQQRGEGIDVQRRWDEMILALNQAIPKGRCDTKDPYEVLENIRKRSELEKEAREVSKHLKNKRLQAALEEYLQPGRLFLHRDGHVYLLFHTYMDHGRFICAAYGLNTTIRIRRGRIRLKKIPLKKIRVIYDYRVSLPDDQSISSILKLIESIEVGALDALNIPNLEEEENPEELKTIQQRLKELPCETCDHLGECHAAKNKDLRRILRDFRSLAYSMEDMGEGLWLNFKRHLRFLKETGFVDDRDHLTPDGIWASKLRLDHPLLIAEAIRRGGFRGESPEIMAGCIAPFVWDRLQDIELNPDEDTELVPIVEAFNQVIKSMGTIRKLKVKRGFINPPILIWPAVTLYLWTKMTPWDELIRLVRVDEGDISSMIIRTADHLRQVANLSTTHPELASTARLAIDLIMREPVFLE